MQQSDTQNMPSSAVECYRLMIQQGWMAQAISTILLVWPGDVAMVNLLKAGIWRCKRSFHLVPRRLYIAEMPFWKSVALMKAISATLRMLTWAFVSGLLVIVVCMCLRRLYLISVRQPQVNTATSRSIMATGT